MKCKSCKREVYSTINDKCYNCYYKWEASPFWDKTFIIFISIALVLIIALELLN